MPLREAYAEIHKDDLAEGLKKAWEEEKKSIPRGSMAMSGALHGLTRTRLAGQS